jgi:hypothetical protein
MPIIGHQITKILGKRGDPEASLDIRANVEITDVRKKDVVIAGDKKPVLDFEFEFTVQYGKKAGGININGILVHSDKEKELDSLAKEWKKNKKLEADVVVDILNRAMELGFIEAIPLSERLRLPPPLRLPRAVKSDAKK